MHIPQSFYLDSRNDDDDDDGDDDGDDDNDGDGDGNDDGDGDGDGPTAELNLLRCPFRGCDRNEAFSTRGNLVRHFQTRPFSHLAIVKVAKYRTDILCHEMCPFCQEIFTQVYRFIKHDCKADLDHAKNTYLQYRYTQLARMARKELNRLQSLPIKTGKRKRGTGDSDSIRARKMIRMIRDSAWPANASLQPHLPVNCSVATDGELACPPDTIKITATNNAEGLLAETVAIMTANNEELAIPADVSSSMPANDGGWAFAETAATVPANDGGWAFAETNATMAAIDGGWAFAKSTISSIPANDSEWAFAEVGAANGAVLAGPGETTASTANHGEGPFAAIMATNGADSAFDFERAAIVAMSNDEWAFTGTAAVL